MENRDKQAVLSSQNHLEFSILCFVVSPFPDKNRETDLYKTFAFEKWLPLWPHLILMKKKSTYGTLNVFLFPPNITLKTIEKNFLLGLLCPEETSWES